MQQRSGASEAAADNSDAAAFVRRSFKSFRKDISTAKFEMVLDAQLVSNQGDNE